VLSLLEMAPKKRAPKNLRVAPLKKQSKTKQKSKARHYYKNTENPELLSK